MTKNIIVLRESNYNQYNTIKSLAGASNRATSGRHLNEVQEKFRMIVRKNGYEEIPNPSLISLHLLHE